MALLANIKGIDLAALEKPGFRTLLLALAFIVMVGMITLKGMVEPWEGIVTMAVAAGITGLKYEINRRQAVTAVKNGATDAKEVPR